MSSILTRGKLFLQWPKIPSNWYFTNLVSINHMNQVVNVREGTTTSRTWFRYLYVSCQLKFCNASIYQLGSCHMSYDIHVTQLHVYNNKSSSYPTQVRTCQSCGTQNFQLQHTKGQIPVPHFNVLFVHTLNCHHEHINANRLRGPMDKAPAS